MNTLVRIAPWALLLIAGACFFGLPGFLAGCAVLVLQEWLAHQKDIEAIAGANEIALARRSDAAEALAGKVSAFEDRLKLLETPERLQATKEILAKFREVVPGLRR